MQQNLLKFAQWWLGVLSPTGGLLRRGSFSYLGQNQKNDEQWLFCLFCAISQKFVLRLNTQFDMMAHICPWHLKVKDSRTYDQPLHSPSEATRLMTIRTSEQTVMLGVGPRRIHSCALGRALCIPQNNSGIRHDNHFNCEESGSEWWSICTQALTLIPKKMCSHKSSWNGLCLQ
jgi:hypothetical protein